ncbi:MAG TPA: mechanosensitive ion channel protein MscS [Porphyromonadaceae bacterium]|nr:mechanosensitive ion channel protein MscS [Porphyromonadaceae bacterium]
MDLSEFLEMIIREGSQFAVKLGGKIAVAILVFVIGKFLINLVVKMMRKLMEKRNLDASVRSFIDSFINILLTIILIFAVISVLGVDITAFAALLASAGVGIGMALSGNLSNFAGGLIILLFKPYRVGDAIDFQGVVGAVKEIQIFHTIMTTFDNKTVYIPNGSLSSGIITNFTHQQYRRVDWVIGVEYGTDYEYVKSVLQEMIDADKRIMNDPAPFIALHQLADSSVNVTMRCWVKSPDYWDVYFSMNQKIYSTFNQKGIGFPFPQLTVHQAKN